MHEVGRTRAGIVRLADRILHEPHRGLLQVAERVGERTHIGLHRLVAGMFLDIALHLVEERHDGAAAVFADLAADQVEALDAVRPLVDHGDAGIAHELLHAVLGDVAMTAVDLLRRHRVRETLIGEHAFDHRGEQAHVVIRRLPGLFVVAAMGNIALERSPQHQRARGLVEGFDRQQAAAHVRMHDDRIGRLVGEFGSGQRATLHALLGIGRGVLIGDLGEREALHADAEPRLVHHHEHGVEAAVRFADQPAGRAVEIHHARRVAVNAHLLLDRAA